MKLEGMLFVNAWLRLYLNKNIDSAAMPDALFMALGAAKPRHPRLP